MKAEAVSESVARTCLLGGALGDALGFPLEFLRRTDIEERFGTKAPESLAAAAKAGPIALVSDDTQMTLFTTEGVIDALIGASEIVPACFAAYRRWLATQSRTSEIEALRGSLGLFDEPALHATRAPATTCLDALASANPKVVPSVAQPPNQSKGCGAITRSAPFGLCAIDRPTAFLVARDAGAITHGHPAGYLPAAVFAALLWGVARGESLLTALTEARLLLGAETAHEETSQAIEAALALGTPTSRSLGRFGERIDGNGKRTRGGGWTADAALGIAIAVASSVNASDAASFADALWLAAAHDGDSDSTASLVGQLLGATRTVSELPSRWLEELELRALIERAADALVQA